MLNPTTHSVLTTPLLSIIVTLKKIFLNKFRLYVFGHFFLFVQKSNIFSKREIFRHTSFLV